MSANLEALKDLGAYIAAKFGDEYLAFKARVRRWL